MASEFLTEGWKGGTHPEVGNTVLDLEDIEADPLRSNPGWTSWS